jgi:hypothetical protein
MSTSFYLSIGLISFVLFLSCSSVYLPRHAFSNQEKNNLYDVSNENNDIPLMIIPKESSFNRLQRSSSFHPRESRNSWFRVSTYQHMKPNGGSEEKNVGDNLMRWG